MKTLFGTLIFLLIFMPFRLIAQDEQLSEIRLADDELRQFGEVEFLFDVNHLSDLAHFSSLLSISHRVGKTVTAYANKEQFALFMKEGLPFKIIPHKPVIRSPQTEKSGLFSWTEYPTCPEYDSIMHKFATDYPVICRLDTIGWSVMGRNLLVLKISDNVLQEEAQPDFLYTATIHGDETGGFVLLLRLAGYLLENYASDTQVTRLVNGLQIWINPLANPDGTYRTIDSLYIPIRYNANGVDLNRNFPDPADGPHPDGKEYQPETTAMMEFMQKHSPVMSANFHGGAEVVNYPWDTWQTADPEGPGYHAPHPDDNWFRMVSKEYADSAQFYSPPGYLTNPSSSGYILGGNWYMISGGRQDYVTGLLNGREVTIELDNTKTTPEADLDNLWEYNYRSLLNFMEQCLFGLSGTVTDSVTGQPLAARIEVLQHDADNSHVFSDSLTGTFHRLIDSGMYRLKITAPGYLEKYIDSVEVAYRLNTSLEIQLVPGSSGTFPHAAVPLPDIEIYPNPFTGWITLRIRLHQPAWVTCRVSDLPGNTLAAFNHGLLQEGPNDLQLDLSGLPHGIFFLQVWVEGRPLTKKIIKQF